MSKPPISQMVEVEGPPIPEALYAIFAPWGIPKGIQVIGRQGIAVNFEGDYLLTFIPVAVAAEGVKP